ncbi:MAG: M42 family peptidase [Oscillospiraceae bacterium]|nr:M42 family peptidase [Oscillospiraceae bacterium]
MNEQNLRSEAGSLVTPFGDLISGGSGEVKAFVLFDTLKGLVEAPGVAGNENTAAAAALEMLREYAPDAALDRHGSVVGIIGDDENKPLLLLDAHIDQIGLIITHINEQGFLKAEPCGGIDRRVLAGQRVSIHGGECRKEAATVCTLPPHVLSGKNADKAMKADSIWLDAGFANKDAALESVALGDFATIDGELTQLTRLCDKTVTSSALDDRAGVCAILYALHLLERSTKGDFNQLPWRIAVSFSVQEELGCRGAGVVAYNTEPDCAIIVDVSFAASGNLAAREGKVGELGKGAMLGYAPALNRTMFEMLKNTAIDCNLPYQSEIMNGDTGGTNADTVSVAKGGVKTALVSIPLRYMHTPVEVADLGDIESAGMLIARFIEGGIEGGVI